MNMTPEQHAALQVLIDAAGSWRDELITYIAPASEDWRDDESAESQRNYADEIDAAIKQFSGGAA